MTIDRQILYGFATLLLALVVLTATALYNLDKVIEESTILADEYIPLSTASESLASEVSLMMADLEIFINKGDREALEKYHLLTEKASSDQEKLRKLIEEYSDLKRFSADIDVIDQDLANLAEYVAIIEKDVTEMQESWEVMAKEATVFEKDLHKIIELRREEFQQTLRDSTNSESNLRLFTLIEELHFVLEQFEKSQISALRAQTYRKASYLEDAMNELRITEEALAKLVPELAGTESEAYLKEAIESERKYKDAIEIVNYDWKELLDLEEKAIHAMFDIIERNGEIAKTSIDACLKIGEATAADSKVSFSIMLWGTVAALIFASIISIMVKKRVVLSLKSAIGSLRVSAETSTRSAQQVSQSSNELARTTSEQASTLEETSSALEEITAMVSKSAEGASKAQEVAERTKLQAEAGCKDMKAMENAMSAISESSSEISKIINTIDEIAF
ncbi:MAG: hypothetical protein AAGB46_19300, partial [Verrucomicrobiota bacterium]